MLGHRCHGVTWPWGDSLYMTNQQTAKCCGVGVSAWESTEDGDTRSGLRNGGRGHGPGLEGCAGSQRGKKDGEGHSGRRNSVVTSVELSQF